ncbi:hypothetical protein FPV67DRAFT_1649615 [Lyophyllum atratum]|nr:hypothetical protein FPV67DRAFT_1649615 [Lyophyllum atratum]
MEETERMYDDLLELSRDDERLGPYPSSTGYPMGRRGDELRVKAYRGALAAWKAIPFVPFVDFCEQLAQALGGSNEAILRAGILDFLLHAYATNFRDPLAPNEGRNFSSDVYLPDCVQHAPDEPMWRPELPFIPDDRNRTEQRVVALNSVPRVVVLWRLQSISDVLLDWKVWGMEISIRALRTLHRMFKYQSQLKSCLKYQESVFFYLPCDHEDFTMTAVPYFIHVFMQVTRYDEAFLIIILAADILGLMRPFLEKELRGKSSYKLRGTMATF